MLQDRQVGNGGRAGKRGQLHRQLDLRLGWRPGRSAGGPGTTARWQGRGVVGRGYRRASQYHGVRPDGEEPGGDLRAIQRQAGRPADGGAQGRPGGRRRQAGHADRRRCWWCGRTAGYLGDNDRFIDIRVYDAPDPIAELDRLLTLHKLYFFPSDPNDLIALSPEIVRQLEPILLREPASQPKKWLAAPQGSPTRAFLEALRDFMYWENYDVRVRMDGKIDRVVLDDILKKHRT